MIPRFLHTIMVLATGLVSLSCDDLRITAIEVKQGEELQLRITEGQSVFLVPGNVTVTFARMLNDFRCPADVMCVWPGMAIIRVDVTTQDNRNTQLIMPMPGLVRTPYRHNRMEAEGYDITLLQLDPYPMHSASEQPRAYEALLAIEKK